MKGIILPLVLVASVVACSGDRADKTQSNTAPQFVTPKSLTLVEGQQLVADLEGFDREGDILEYSLVGGVDNGLFNLHSTGKLLFKNLPDYESPIDATNDNRYELKVRVSDGLLSSEENFTIEVLDALEGRVVDGPLAGAQLFIDCNADGIRGTNEPQTTTNEDGFYAVVMPNNCDNQLLVSQGGFDIATENETNIVLMAKLPNDFDLSQDIVLTPVSTVMSYTAQENQEILLRNLGITGLTTSAQLLSIDPWLQSTSSGTQNASYFKTGDDLNSGIEIQKLNGQLVTLMATADSLSESQSNVSLASTIADIAGQPDAEMDLTNAVVLKDIFDVVLDDQEVPDVIFEALATSNSFIAAQSNPASDNAIAMQANSQQQLQTNIVSLANGDLSDQDFIIKNGQALTAITQSPLAIPSIIEVPYENEVVVFLSGSKSNGQQAEVFRIEELPSHGSLRDTNGVMVEPESLPFILSSHQVFYTNTSKASDDSFVFKVLDKDSNSNSALVGIKVTGVNDRPVATNQIASMEVQGSTEIKLEGFDKQGDQLRYKIVDLPKHGKLIDGDKELRSIDLNYLLSENSITYINSSSNVTTDEFYFVSFDGQLNSRKAKVTINISAGNDIPVIKEQKPLSIAEDTAFDIHLSDLTVTDSDNSYPDDFTLMILRGQNFTIDNTRIVPDADFVGNLLVPISVSDGTNFSPVFNLSIDVTAINDAPTIVGQITSSLVTDEDHSIAISLDNFVVTDADSPLQDLNLQVLPGQNYTVDKAVIEPDENYSGFLDVPILISDGITNSDQFNATIKVKAINDAPEIKSSQIPPINEDDSVALTLSYLQVTDIDNTYPNNFTLTVLDGENYDLENNKVIPHEHYAGTLSVPLSVNDGLTDSDIYHAPIVVNEVNDQPQALNKAVSVKENKEFLIELEGYDVEDSSLTYEIVNQPVFGVFTQINGAQLFYKSTSDTAVSDSFTYRVKDSLGAESEAATLSIAIEPANDLGYISIEGSLTLGQIVIASVSDRDGFNENEVSYQWQRFGGPNSIRGDYGENVGNNAHYLITANDIGAKIRVTAQYTDNQIFFNQVSSIESPISELPITKKTVNIADAYIHYTVLDNEQIRTRLNIENISDYTLKELTNPALIEIAKSFLPDENPNNIPGGIDNILVLGYEHIQHLFNDLPDSDIFRIYDKKIIINELPSLKRLFVGTNFTRIGQSHSLAIFDKQQRLKGLVNIRFAPAEVNNSICLNPDFLGSMPQNPVILVHGWNVFGKGNIANIDHFNKIAEHLNNATDAPVFTTEVSPWGSIEERGEQLIAYIECVLNTDPMHSKVDLIGHSLGGPTSRYAAYWLAKHDGHDYPTKVNSVSSVSGTNMGGNVYVTSKQHLDKVLNMKPTLYQMSMLIPYATVTDIVFKFVSKNDFFNPQSTLGKQRLLLFALLDKLANGNPAESSCESNRQCQLLDSVKKTLAGSRLMLDKVIDVVEIWHLEENENGLINLLVSLRGPLTYLGLCIDGDWYWCNRTELEDLIYDLYSNGFRPLLESGRKIRSALNFIEQSNILTNTKLMVFDIKNELRKLEFEEEPDYYKLISHIASFQEDLSGLERDFYDEGGNKLSLMELDSYIDDFANALIQIQTVINRYLNYSRLELFDVSFKDIFSEYVFLGINDNEISDIRDAVRDFAAILASDTSPSVKSLLVKIKNQDIDSILWALVAGSEESVEVIESLSELAKISETLLANFTNTATSYRSKFLTIEGLEVCSEYNRIGRTCTSTSLVELADAFQFAQTGLSRTKSALTDIKNYLSQISGISGGEWKDLISWEFEQFRFVREKLIADFLSSDAAAKFGLTPQELNDCLVNNQPFKAYVNEQLLSDVTTLPDASVLSETCSGFINKILDASLELIMPLNKFNAKTQRFPDVDIKFGSFSIGPFAPQIFNLKYPDTGITLGNFEKCRAQEEPDNYLFFNSRSRTSNFNNSRQNQTKYYSWLNQRSFRRDNWSDRLLTNVMIPANNPRLEVSDLYTSFSDLSVAFMIDRDSSVEVENEQSAEEIQALFKHSDFMVHLCSQELGQVVGLADLNHMQSTNNELYLTHEEDLINLFKGQVIGGNFSISSEMLACNTQTSVRSRNTCLSDLFPRALIAFGLYKAKSGSEDTNKNGLLDIFDSLLGFFAEEVEMAEVSDNPNFKYVPDMYLKLLLEAQSDAR